MVVSLVIVVTCLTMPPVEAGEREKLHETFGAPFWSVVDMAGGSRPFCTRAGRNPEWNDCRPRRRPDTRRYRRSYGNGYGCRVEDHIHVVGRLYAPVLAGGNIHHSRYRARFPHNDCGKCNAACGADDDHQHQARAWN